MAAISRKPPSRKVGGNSLVAIAGQIKALEKKNIANLVEIGGLLEEAAKLIPRGEYGAWLKANFGWSSKTAYRYRMVSNLAVVCQIDKKIDIETDLNLSLSALYLLADMPVVDARSIAIVAAARCGRVTYSAAKQIIADTDKAEAEKAAAREQQIKQEAEKATPDIDTRSMTAFTPVKEVEKAVVRETELPDQETLDRVKGVLDTRKPKPATATVVPVADTKDDPASEHHDDLARMLSLSHILLHNSGVDVEKAVAKVGTSMVREIIARLKSAIDKYDATTALATKADAAVARSNASAPPAETPATKKAASIGDAIAKGVAAWCADEQAKADAAEPKTIKATPPADCPDIPPFLDRRQTAEVDQEAAEIAAKAANEKRWLNS